MHKKRRVYEAREKILFEGVEPGTYVQFFKDNNQEQKPNYADSVNFEPAESLDGKAVLHNRISEYIFSRLSDIGIPSYFIRSLNMREQLVHRVEMLPLRLVCRNAAAGSLMRRFGLMEGVPLPRPVFEFYYQDESLGFPLISEEHILTFGWANEQDLEEMLTLTGRINDFLCGMFAAIGFVLADFKLEFGHLWEGDALRIVLADEISPDSCRLWDRESWKRHIGNIPPIASVSKKIAENRNGSVHKFKCASYQQVAQRLGLLVENHPLRNKGPVLVCS